MSGRGLAMIKVFASWRMLIVLMIGFSSGAPFALTGATLQAWMKSEHVDLAAIGLISLVTLPYALKFLWSPLMDRFVPPLLGRRRGWMLLCQLALAGGIAAMAFSSPTRSPVLMSVLALLVAFFSASQDIVINAYQREVLRPEELGAGASIYVIGYQVAMLVSSALALILADHMPWRTVYLMMAATMVVGIAASLLGPEPRIDARPPQRMSEAVVQPLVEFLRRHGALEMLAFILLYKLDVFITQAMVTPFLMDIGFSMTDIGTVNKLFGLGATIAGGLLGGSLMVRLGLYRSLWVFGLLQGVSGMAFVALAGVGNDYRMLVVANILQNLCVGMGVSAFTAFLMSLCDKRFTATQFALLSSLMGLSRSSAGATGPLAKWLTVTLGASAGWQAFFVIATLVAVPGLLLLLRYGRWQMPKDEAAEPQAPAAEPATASAAK